MKQAVEPSDLLIFCIIVSMAAQMQFAVVEFADASAEIVPLKWLNAEEDACYWPPVKGTETKFVRSLKDASRSWQQYAVRVLGKAGLCIIHMMCVWSYSCYSLTCHSWMGTGH